MTALIWLSGLVCGAIPAWLITAAIAAKEMRRKGAEWDKEKRRFEQRIAAHQIALLEAYKQDVRPDVHAPSGKIWVCNRGDFNLATTLSYTFRHRSEPPKDAA